MATIRILLGIICLAFAGSFVKLGSDILERSKLTGLGSKVNYVELSSSMSKRLAEDEERFNLEDWKVERLESWHVAKRTRANEQRFAKPETNNRTRVIAIAKSQIGVREATGNNDGLDVEKYLHYTGNKKGDPWCASFVSWIFGKAGYHQPKSAWSPALFPKARQLQNPATAMVFGIYFPKLKRIAHCGIISKVNDKWIYTIEGNTNIVGSREGDGVYQRIRHERGIAFYANWLNEKGAQP